MAARLDCREEHYIDDMRRVNFRRCALGRRHSARYLRDKAMRVTAVSIANDRFYRR